MHVILPLFLLTALSAPPQALSAPPRFDVQLLDGSKVSGSLASWDEKQVVVVTPAGRRELAAAKVASLAAHAPPAKPAAKPAVWVDLADGSHLAAKEYVTGQGRAKIALASNEIIEVPVSEVTAVRMQPESEASALEWSRIRGKNLQGDLLVTGNQSGIDFHQGAIENVGDQKVHFVLDGKGLDVKRSKIYGLVYYHAAGASASESPYTIVDADGCRWVSPTLKLAGDKIEFTAPGDLSLSRGLDQIVQIDLSSGKIVYLSDLKPDSEKYAPSPFTVTARELPIRAQFSRVRRDESDDAKPLVLFGQIYRRGMAVQSRSELAWTLPGKFSRLQGVAGIDDEFRPLGNVRLQILGDGKSLLDVTVGGSESRGKPIGIDVAGVRRLVLVVESLGNLGAGDHLILGNLRLIK